MKDFLSVEEQQTLVALVIFFGFFLAMTSVLQEFSKKTGFPYTIALLLVGFVGQLFVQEAGSFVESVLHLHLEIGVDPDLIFYFLLPTLLFESAFHINVHQFRLQFSTITFLTTFGLLLSVGIVTLGLHLLLGLPVGVALLFGALISATDPIAVLALFKTLKTPKRLALLADGESMFNDATAVILFRIVSAVVIGKKLIEEQSPLDEGLGEATEVIFGFSDLLAGLGEFFYVFVGSILYGVVLGYFSSILIEKIKNDRLVETTLTVALALFSFSSSEHFFGLSGVISCVLAAITLGNLGRTRFSSGVITFIEEFWEYLGFLAVSVVFFFASYSFLNISILLQYPGEIFLVYLVALIARALSVYATFFFTNRLSFFKYEPNVPMKWQHILNWGGLRGVIPLVLVFTIPESYEYKELLIAFTFGTIVLSLFINGGTVKYLLLKLKLHVPGKEEEILCEEMSIFEIKTARRNLQQMGSDLDQTLLQNEDSDLYKQEELHKKQLLKIASPDNLRKSLKLEAITIERKTLQELFAQGHINENVYYTFDVELDLQEDALIYHDLHEGRGYSAGGLLPRRSLRQNILRLRVKLSKIPVIGAVLSLSQEQIIEERFTLLRVRILSSTRVLAYLESVRALMSGHGKCLKAIEEVMENHRMFIRMNEKQISELKEKYPEVIKKHQQRVIKSLLKH